MRMAEPPSTMRRQGETQTSFGYSLSMEPKSIPEEPVRLRWQRRKREAIPPLYVSSSRRARRSSIDDQDGIGIPEMAPKMTSK
jgi:hypothetical protein